MSAGSDWRYKLGYKEVVIQSSVDYNSQTKLVQNLTIFDHGLPVR